MARKAASKKQITIEEAACERLPDRITQAIRRTIIVEEPSEPKQCSLSISQGVLDVNVRLQIRIVPTLTTVTAIVTGLAGLAKFIKWLMEYLKPIP